MMHPLPMITLQIRDRITDAGRIGGHNEDRLGATARSAFVIDGATGLSDGRLFPEFSSDAEWLADRACRQFEAHGDLAVETMVEAICREAADAVGAAAGEQSVPAWALPIAGFQMIRIEGEAVVSYGLGDCRLFVLSDRNGSVFDTSALRDNPQVEREQARAAVELAGGLKALGALNAHPDVRERLRQSRALCNRPGARVWTLGTVPDAANHIVREVLPLKAPLTGLLCSDGFAALCDQYGLYDPAGFIVAARDRGLAALLDELRDLERVRDPDGRTYPRYKISDDATAVLFDIGTSA
jgi:hypothetical protein